MKKWLEVALGVLTAIGGFVDIGELVTAPAVGARFGMTLAWATVLSLLGIMIFAEMAGRVAHGNLPWTADENPDLPLRYYHHRALRHGRHHLVEEA